MKKIDGFDGFERALREEKREKERREEVNKARTRNLIATAGVATVLMLGINSSLSNRVAEPVAETKLVEEEPKTYLAASGTWLNKYLDQDFKEEPARFVVAKNANGSVEEVRIGTDNGTHWNIYSCQTDGAITMLYDVDEKGEKRTDYAGRKDGEYCHIGYASDGSVSIVSVTNKASESDPKKGFKSCPSSESCSRYTVRSKWAATTSNEPTPDAQQMNEIGNTQERLRAEDRQKDFDRKWAEGEVEDLKKACRMGQKHWTLCPDGYDKR